MPSWIPHARGNQALSAKTPLKTNPLRSGSASGIPLRVQTAHAQTTQSSSADGDNGDANDTAATETIINATIDSFFKGLEPEDQTLFKATTLASQLLQDVQAADKRHHERSTTRRIVVALKPFIAGVEHYGKAWDVMSNANSLVCPIWASVRLLLRWASDLGDYFERLATMFSQIGRHLIGIRRYPTLYPNNKILRAAMVEIFQTIFQFLNKAARVFREDPKVQGVRGIHKIKLPPLIKTLWTPFKLEFGDAMDRISLCMEDIETEVDIAEKELASEERRKAEEEREMAQQERARAAKERTLQVQERFRRGTAMALMGRASIAWTGFVDDMTAEKLNTWLAPVNIDSNHKAATKARHAASGTWFLQSQAFQQWLEEDNSFMWLNAIHGAGKTVLASTIINHLLELRESSPVGTYGVAYFYCDYRETLKQQPLKALTTILSSLSSQNRTIFRAIQAFFQYQIKQNPAYVPEFDELLSNFGTFIGNQFERVLIVVDALDECADRECLALALKQISQTCLNARVLVTSRNEIDITRAFEGLPQWKIGEDDVALDIEGFIRAELATCIKTKKLKLRNQVLEDIIAKSLVEGAKGMFQWAKCQIEQLCKLRTDNAIRAALKDLPKTLHDTYFRILERIQGQSEDEIRSVQRLLRWLVRGARNLTLEELAECISIEMDGEDEHMDFDNVPTDAEDILEQCGSLLSISVDNYVTITHYSAKEFLVSEDLKKRMPEFWVGGNEVDSELATVCLKYLCYDDFAGGAFDNNDAILAKLDEYKALKYASQFWALHASRSKSDPQQSTSVVDLTMRLFDTSDQKRKNFQLWKQIYYFKPSVRHHPITRSACNPLSFASCYGLTGAVEQLLRASIPTDCSMNLKLAASEGHIDVVKAFLSIVPSCSRPNIGSAIYAAAAKGHVEIVELLLDEGINDIDVRAGKDGTALQAAALEGRFEVVKLLLDRGANAKLPCKRWGTPLAAAAEKGHLKTVRVLLDDGANPNGPGGWFFYPLISAVAGKNMAIIDLLLERGADVNAEGGRYGSALMAAAGQGMPNLVKKLVQEGAKVNDEDDKGSDALYAACAAGHLDVVNLLLELGADVNAKGGKHRNALNAASAEGKVEIVKRLIEVGADIHVFDDHVGNALQLAAYRGNDDIVRILAEAGVDVNTEGGQRGSALLAAASRGHTHIVRLLFELGVEQGDVQEVVDALVSAAYEGHKGTIAALLDTGVTEWGLNQVSSMNRPPPGTVLEAAAAKGYVDIVKLLLERGADVNATHESSSLGFPLLAAADVSKPSIDMITALLDAGADPNLTVLPRPHLSYGYALPAATVHGDIDCIKLLVERGADVNLVFENRFTAMEFAAGKEDPSVLEYLLSRGGDVNLSGSPNDKYPNSPLQQAAFSGAEENLRKLVKLGAKLSVENENAWFKNALQAASAGGHVDLVRALIEYGCDVNEIGGHYGTSLIAAAFFNHTEVIKALLDAGADINIGNVGSEHRNALIAAVQSEYTDGVQLLLERGADPNIKGGGEFEYPLHAAAWMDYDQTIKVLLDNGAEVNITGGRYMTALQAAASEYNQDAYTVLLEYKADPNIIGGEHGTALAAAYTGGAVGAINALYREGANNCLIGGSRKYHSAMGGALQGACQGLISNLLGWRGYDLNLTYGKYGSPLQHLIATQRGDVPLGLFFAANVNVNHQGGFFGSALTAAAYYNDIEAIDDLLEHGADPMLQGSIRYPNPIYGVVDGSASRLDLLHRFHNMECDIHGSETLHGTPIQRAAFNGKLNMVIQLHRWGADPDAFPSKKHGSALQVAATVNASQTLRYLVRTGSNVNLKGGSLGSPLIAAVMKCSLDDIELLLKRGADPNQRCGKYGYALQAAAVVGRSEVILLLLRYGAAINAIGGKFGTALQGAVASTVLDVVKLMVERGADPSIEAGFYRTPLHHAALWNLDKFAQYLFSIGAPAVPIDRRKLAHSWTLMIEAGEKTLEKICGGDDNEDEGKDGDKDEQKTADDEEQVDEDRTLQLNAMSIPGFAEPYVPAPEDPESEIEIASEVETDSEEEPSKEVYLKAIDELLLVFQEDLD